MRIINYLSILVLLFKPVILFSQISDFQSGARSQGMGNASVANSDIWSVFNNIGALADERDLSIALAYSTYHQVEGFKSAAICANIPTKPFNLGFGIFYFGDEVYNEGKISIGASHKINFVSLGANLNYLQYNVLEFGTANSWVLEMGGKVQIHPSLFFGANIFNVNQATLSGQQNIGIPTVMKAGISYQPKKSAMLNVEIEKNPEKKTSVKTGVEYGLVKQVFLRTGVATYPATGYFGIGFIAKKGTFDYALSHSSPLGLSHQVSANIKLKPRNESQ
jgi:hypothetical protein